MISWVVIMLLFWYYQKLSQLDQGPKYRMIIDPRPLQLINDKILFAFHIYLKGCIVISKSN